MIGISTCYIIVSLKRSPPRCLVSTKIIPGNSLWKFLHSQKYDKLGFRKHCQPRNSCSKMIKGKLTNIQFRSLSASCKACSASLRNKRVSCFCPHRYAILERLFLLNFCLVRPSVSLLQGMLKKKDIKDSFYSSPEDVFSWKQD